MNSNVKKNALYVLLMLAGLFSISLFIFPNSAPEVEKENSASDLPETFSLESPQNKNTIASAWQWDIVQPAEGNNQQAAIAVDHAHTASTLPFTEASVYQALHAVKLDENDDIILDDDALNALNAALDHDDVSLDREGLDALQTLIRKGLPGHAGEQTARIVADYYQYLGAKDEFNTLYETNNHNEQTIEGFQAQYEELLALRDVYLGTEVASKLFASSNANARYMFESMMLEANMNLSDAEKKQAQASNIERHSDATSKVNNWIERYQLFLDDKQYIINSSVSKDEKHDQITALMHERFSDEELEYVSHLQLDSL